MPLFECDPQYREKLTIWRVLSLLPLYAPLAEGRIWKWFAINIPMQIGNESGHEFTSDLDIIACLSDISNSRNWIYKTWEVKVSLLDKYGIARSLKVGKIKRTKIQLNAYRNFGAAMTTLLDIYICEDGFLQNNEFPTKEVVDVIGKKNSEFKVDGFGYQMLTFEHRKDGNDDIGLFTPFSVSGNPVANVLPPKDVGHRQPFSRLTDDISKFFEQQTNPRKSFNQVVYCKNCRQFQLIDMKHIFECPNCMDDFIQQT